MEERLKLVRASHDQTNVGSAFNDVEQGRALPEGDMLSASPNKGR